MFLLPFTAFAQEDSLNIHSLFHWEDGSLVPSNAHFNVYNEIWGVAIDGREYAIIGTTAGTHFFDVTDPANSTQVDFVPGRFQGEQVVHRDYHDYGCYLYMVCDEGQSSLQIADLSYLPDSVHVVYDEDTVMKTSHNIFIDTTTALMYAVAGVGMGNQLDVYSLANPETPERIAQMSVDVPWWPLDIGPLHDIFVRDNIAYCNAGNGSGLYVVDFTDPLNPVLTGSLTNYAQNGYNHSGWLSDDGNTYVLCDENHGLDVKFLDVSDLSDITVLDTVNPGIDSISLPHNVLIKGDYAYISYYFDGLQIYDISDPSNPVRTGFYDTSTRTPMDGRYEGNWGVYPHLPSGNVLLSDMQTGLWVVNSDAATPNLNYNYPAPQCGMNTGIADVEQPVIELALWPNPVSTSLTIDVAADAAGTYALMSLTGQSVLTGRISGQTAVPVPATVAAGLYLLRLELNGTVVTRRLAVVR